MSKMFDEDKITEYRALLADVSLENLEAMTFEGQSPEQREAVRREIAARDEQGSQVINDAINLTW